MRRRRLLVGLAVIGAVSAGCTTRASLHRAAPTSSLHPVMLNSGPAWFAVLQNGRVRWHDSHTGEPFGLASAPTHSIITSITSWNDDHTVLEAAQNLIGRRCSTALQLQRVEGPRAMLEQSLTPLPAVPGVVSSMAVSRDQQTLALAVNVTFAHTGRCGTGRTQSQLWVVDLRSGSRRVWTLPVDEPTSDAQMPEHHFVDALTFAPDGHRLAMVVGECCAYSGQPWVLDANAPTGELTAHIQRVPSGSGSCAGPPFLWLSTGLLSDDCNASMWTFSDPKTGNTVSTLAPASGNTSAISVDTSGQHYIAYVGQQVVRIDNGQVRSLMSLPWDGNTPPSVAW